jgi:hypothetical protein
MHMTAVSLSEQTLKHVKRALQASFPGFKSSHITEALAGGLGFRTHAALVAFRNERGDFPEFALFDQDTFIRRMRELTGEPVPEDEDDRWFDDLDFADRIGIKATEHPKYERDRHNLREMAQAVVLTAAVNEGIERRLFSLVPNDNRWTGGHGEAKYPFTVDDYFGWARVSDAGFGELNLHAVVSGQPMPEWPRYVKGGSIYAAAVLVASSWLERDAGHWIQDASHDTYISNAHRARIAAAKIRPRGFGPFGRMMM